jgi:hypothetical protein
MPNDLKLANVSVNAEADAFARLLDNGYLRIYSGTKPATGDTALSGNTLLAELRYANPSAAAAVAGVLTFSAIASDTAADATGTATFFRAFTAPMVDRRAHGSTLQARQAASGRARVRHRPTSIAIRRDEWLVLDLELAA